MFTIHAYPLTGWCPYCQKPTAQDYRGDYRYVCKRCKREFIEKP